MPELVGSQTMLILRVAFDAVFGMALHLLFKSDLTYCGFSVVEKLK